jgi:hypothetical protein
MSVEYSVPQLMGVCMSIMDFCKKNHFSADAVDQMRVRLSDPKADGTITFDLGSPSPWNRTIS